MSAQPSILEMIHGEDTFQLEPIVQPERGEATGLEARFKRFHELNPHVYAIIARIALGLKDRGFRRAGMKMIFERMRWLWAMQTRGEDYKLNNNYTAFYARMVMRNHPELAGFFEIRAQRHGRRENDGRA